MEKVATVCQRRFKKGGLNEDSHGEVVVLTDVLFTSKDTRQRHFKKRRIEGVVELTNNCRLEPSANHALHVIQDVPLRYFGMPCCW